MIHASKHARTALVLGATGGIGGTIDRALGDHGWTTTQTAIAWKEKIRIAPEQRLADAAPDIPNLIVHSSVTKMSDKPALSQLPYLDP